MALRTKAVAITLLGAALIASLFLFSTRDRTALNKEISHMISNEVEREKTQNLGMGDTANNRYLQVPKNTLTELLESVKSLKTAFKTMRKGMEEREMQLERRVEGLHNQLGDGQDNVDTKDESGKVSVQTQSAKDPLRITEWWQASSLLKWDWEKPPEYTCGKMEMRGSWRICNDNNFEVKPPCLVYSFGIWKDWSFDDAMGALGCEVHSFDPSIGLKSFDRSQNVHFHDLALSYKDSDTYVPPKDRYVKTKTTWKIRRLKTIMEMLGHTNRHLDVLKIDIETSEWPAVKDIAESGLFSKVRQFSVEWHLFPTHPNRSEYINCYTSVMAMKEQGLRTFRSLFHKQNYEEKTFRFQADVNYVNILHKGT
ncbi:uncharacterized protein LOC124256498 isoform X2 [Haliotis rubra]|uniref:uncharacterized protein LOC124256498 isoform X2 n=1 Tax=Haliotis rubra TaxID=36100 RepID=UPI001EE54EDE|nr:uncharacterized protein LOC124256498 isoform X2 [Haliotis rubra]